MKKRSGFTLFEVLITLAILAVVFAILYMTFHQSMRVMADTEEQAEIIYQGRLILERMTKDMEGIFLPTQNPPSATFRYGLIGRSTRDGKNFRDRLDFTALASPYFSPGEGRGELREVGYFLDHHPGGKNLTLFRRQDGGLDGDLLQGGISMAICDGVQSLSFSYFDDQGRELKEWNSLEGAQANKIPVRIGILLTIEDSQGRAHEFRTQVFIPSAL
jgi:prepilin-type N-terminal cleavage/methylation domain-containing protein